MNYTKARHELRDFLRDTNYTNYHEGFEGLGNWRKLLKFVSQSTRIQALRV